MAAPVLQLCVSLPTPEEIDRYGDLHLKIQLFAPVLEEHELLKKKILASLASQPADLPAVAEGARYSLRLTARRLERVIVNRKLLFNRLRKLIGLDAFLDAITIPLGELVDKNFPVALQAAFLVSERTGPRTMTVVPKTPPQAA